MVMDGNGWKEGMNEQEGGTRGIIDKTGCRERESPFQIHFDVGGLVGPIDLFESFISAAQVSFGKASSSSTARSAGAGHD